MSFDGELSFRRCAARGAQSSARAADRDRIKELQLIINFPQILPVGGQTTIEDRCVFSEMFDEFRKLREKVSRFEAVAEGAKAVTLEGDVGGVWGGGRLELQQVVSLYRHNHTHKRKHKMDSSSLSA